MFRAVTPLLAGGPLASAPGRRHTGRPGAQGRRHFLMAIAAAAFCLLCASVAHAQTPTTPTVSTISVTSNPGTDNAYATGDKIEVTVTFSEAVTVSTTDGTPRLSIDIGGQPRNIPYDRAGSSTGQLIFGYTVFAGDMDANGIAVKADGLALNGGTIRSTDDSTDADLGLILQLQNKGPDLGPLGNEGVPHCGRWTRR